MAQQHTRRDFVRRRQQKKKRRMRAVFLVLAALAVCAAVLYTVLQDHLVFTADGMHFVFSKTDGRDPENPSAVASVPQQSRDGFYPRASASVSVESNGLPPFGAGYMDALYLDVDSFAADEVETVAAQLVIQEIRSIVVDIKCDDGRLNYDSDTAFSRTAAPGARDGKLETLLAQCAARGIRVCGRISCFRDNTLPRKVRTTGIFTKDGELFEDAQAYTWLDPYEADVRDYLTQVCAEAAKLGVREILLDHYSFLGENPDDAVKYSGSADKSELLSSLLGQLRTAAGEDVYLSVVIYPDVLGEGGSERKGQNLESFAGVCDRLWIRCDTSAQAEGFRLQALVHSPQTADMLALIIGGRYVSASLVDE